MNEVRTKADQILKKGKSRMPAMDLSFWDLFYVFLRHEITQSPKSRRYEKICISSRYRLVSADTRRRQGLC